MRPSDARSFPRKRRRSQPTDPQGLLDVATGLPGGYVSGGFVDDVDGVRLGCPRPGNQRLLPPHRHRSWAALRKLSNACPPDRRREGSTVVGGLEKVRRVAPSVVAETLPGTTPLFPMEQPDPCAPSWPACSRRRERIQRDVIGAFATWTLFQRKEHHQMFRLWHRIRCSPHPVPMSVQTPLSSWFLFGAVPASPVRVEGMSVSTSSVASRC